MSPTRISRRVNAPRASGRDRMVPTVITNEAHAFDAREGGTFRIPLTCNESTGTGKMTIITVADTGGGTEVPAVHDRLPPADNEFGWREALAKLAALVEAG